MKTLLKGVCPYCIETKNFASNQKLLGHINKQHQKVVPPRPKPMQNLPDEVPCTIKYRELNPEAPTKLACPSCNMSFYDKESLKIHIEVDHVELNGQRSTTLPNTSWQLIRILFFCGCSLFFCGFPLFLCGSFFFFRDGSSKQASV